MVNQDKIVRTINIVEGITQIVGNSGSDFLNTLRQCKDEMDYSTNYGEAARFLLSELEKYDGHWQVEATNLLRKALEPAYYCVDLVKSIGGFTSTSDLCIRRFRAEIPVDGKTRVVARHSWEELASAIEALIEFHIIK